MKIILNNVKASVNATDNEIFQNAQEVLEKYGIKSKSISLCRKSLDARRKNNIHYVCAVYADTDLTKKDISELKNPDIRPFEELDFDIKKVNKRKKIIVVGTGPCGLFAAYILARAGMTPLVIERGADVESRDKAVKAFWKSGILDKNTNIQFGEGGAGTFSDGKLTTRIGDPLQKVVLSIFANFGAPKDILYSAKPHIGTDKLKALVKNMRIEIERLGGTVRFNSRLENIILKDKKIVGAKINGAETECDAVVLAIGHSSRDTYEMLCERGVLMTAKAFAAGVRIEHKQSFINKMQYGNEHKNPCLPPADYRFAFNEKKRSCYSFCMCPGGAVVNASSEEGGLVINGMSEYLRDGENANSALIVTVNPSDFESAAPLAGVEFQRKYERLAYEIGGGYNAPVQLAKDFVSNKISQGFEEVIPSYTGKTVFADLRECLPRFICETLSMGLLSFEKKAAGYLSGGAVLTGVEMRSSAPLRILRDENFESINVKGLYPAGEGAGYAGGIMSAALDGIKIGLKLSGNI